MSSMASMKNGAVKEEGELTDDDEEENILRHYRHAHLSSENRRGSRYISAEQINNYELGEKGGSKRRDSRRRVEADNRRSSRNAASGAARKHHREHQDLRQVTECESYTPSKFWANRRFRASSVRAPSPRDDRQSGPRRTDSPQTTKHKGQDDSGEGSDELARLEQEQRRIREQLKSLEEEELNNRGNENDCALDNLETRSQTGDHLINAFSGSSDSASFGYLLEAEKSEDEDIDVQELRRLALATSERHIRLMASEPQPSQPGVLSDDVVVIPDMEPVSPDPVVVMVDEDEDVDKRQNDRSTTVAAEVSPVQCLPAKTRHKKSGKLKKKGMSLVADHSDSQDPVRVDVRSKVTVPIAKKSKGKKRKKVNAKEVEEWNRQRQELKVLVMGNPTKALEKLLKFSGQWEGPIVTGTIKDFKRQKQIPVLSDKRAVQSFSQKSVGKKPLAQVKPKEVQDHGQKPGQLQDNYEEVEMDIESDAGEAEVDELLFGEDLNQAMLPVSCYYNTESQDLLGSLPHTVAVPAVTPCVPSQFLTPPVTHFDGILQLPPQPPLPPPPPPPPPPPSSPPPTYEQEWNSKQTLMQERHIEVMNRRVDVGRGESHNLIYCDSAQPVYSWQQGGRADCIDAAMYSGQQGGRADCIDAPDANIHSLAPRSRSESGLADSVDVNSTFQNSVSSLDDDIGRRLRMIRQNQDSRTPNLPDLNLHIVFPGLSDRRYVFEGGEKALFQHLLPSTDVAEDAVTAEQRSPLYSSVLVPNSSHSLPDTDGVYKRHVFTHSPSVSDRRNQSGTADTDSTNYVPSGVDKYVELSPGYQRTLMTNHSGTSCVKPVRIVYQDRSAGRPSRNSPGKYPSIYRDSSSSAHSSPDPSRPVVESQSEHDFMYSSPQRSVSRDRLRDHVSDKASVGSNYLSQGRLHDASHHRSSSPHQQTHRRRSHSSERHDVYEPQLPPTKKFKRLSPPPLYIPTSIKAARTPSSLHVPQQEVAQTSDSEEEDPVALRNRLLAEVIEKRKTLVEGPSSNTTPSGMSPRQDSTHSESSESFSKAYDPELSVSYPDGFKSSVVLHRVSEEEDEENIQPPPVIHRHVRQHLVPPALVELCKRKVGLREDKGSRQEEHLGLKHDIQPVAGSLQSECLAIDQALEEDNEGLSSSDLQILRDFILKAQQHRRERQQSWDQDAHTSSKVPQEMCSAAEAAASSSSVLQTDKPHYLKNVLSSSWDDSRVNSYEGPQMPSVKSLLSAASRHSVPTSEHQWIEETPHTELVSSCHVTSSVASSIAAQSSSLVGSSEATSPRVCSQTQPLSVFPEPPALSDSSAKSPEVSSSPSAVLIPSEASSLTKEPKSASCSHQRLQLSASIAQNVKTISRDGYQTSYSNVDVFTSSALNSHSSQATGHLAPGSQRQPDCTQVQTCPAAAGTGRVLGDDVNITHCAVVTTAQHSIQQSGPTQLTLSDSSTTLSSFSDRPSLSYSSHVYTSFAQNTSRKYSNVHLLPVHPKVLVPMNSSSESDGDGNEENESQTSVSTTLAARTVPQGQKKPLDTLLASQGILTEMQDNKKAATELLRKQEQLLGVQEQSIQKDQKAVKLLVRRTVKFLEAQQQEEEKRQSLRKQLLSLSQEMKKAEKLVMLFKVEKEKTEKQVQLVTERLLQKKKQYEQKAKSIMSLGSKLLGPSYVPRVNKPHDLAGQEKHNLARAQHIAQEKLKLIEKEKQIVEKLRKLKEAQGDKETAKSTAVKHVPDVLKRAEPKWKSQDVIRIDRDAQPDISVKQRRKSLLDMNLSTTPNIPLTPHRSHSLSASETDNVLEATAEVRQTDQDGLADLSLAFKMPSGTQLANFCKLQREKTQRYLQNPSPSSLTSVCPYTSLTVWQNSKVMSKIRLHGTERTVSHTDKDTSSFVKTSHVYTSPLLVFRSYRLNSYFRTKENLSLQSSTYSHKINPNGILCPYDLQGTCNDDSCKLQHPGDYKLSDHELLEDIVSYCPKLAGASDNASPEEIKTCIVTFVDNILSRHKTKMTIDDLCLWLLSQVNEASGRRHPHTISLQPRVWKPQPKEELSLSLDLDQKLTSHGVEALNVDRRFSDKDSIIGEEDVRYFTADVTEMLSLEADIMRDQTNVKLWQKLASKKLSDPNRSPTECLDQALSVLARGLEFSRHDPDLWQQYLTLYKRHPEVKDFPELCHTALEYAPSYELWFLYLESLKTYSEKDKVCSEALCFLCDDAKRKGAVSLTPSVTRASETNTLDSYSKIVHDNEMESEVRNTLEGSEKNNPTVVSCDTDMTDPEDKSNQTSGLKHGSITTEVKENHRNLNGFNEFGISNVAGDKSGKNSRSYEQKQVSHEALEMVLYKTCLNLQTGRFKTALHFLQMVLGLKKQDSSTCNVTELLTPADLLVLWMCYICVLEWQQLPQHIYSMANQNPGRLLAKESISLPWSVKTSLYSTVEHLVKLHHKAARVWKDSPRDQKTAVFYVELIESHVSLLKSQNRRAEAVATCRSVLSEHNLVDVWLLLADLHAASDDRDAVQRVFTEALSVNRDSSKLQFYQCVYLCQQGEAEVALKNLQQFAVGHFDVSSRNIHHYDSRLLYSQLLKQQEAFSLHMAPLRAGVAQDTHQDVYMWLCYSLLLELQGHTEDTIEVFERSLTHAQAPTDVVLVWQSYISYLARCGASQKDMRETIMRSLISVPVKFPTPFSPPASAMWVDYYHSNRLVEAWLAVCSPEDGLDLVEMCLTFMPSNVQLLLRAIELSLRQKMTRRAYSWCQFLVAQTDRPANLAFWKMAVALAQVEGTPREVENLLVDCVRTMPLAVSAWKDLLLFEVTRENTAAVQKLLTYCQHLQLNIHGFVATLSAPSQ